MLKELAATQLRIQDTLDDAEKEEALRKHKANEREYPKRVQALKDAKAARKS